MQWIKRFVGVGGSAVAGILALAPAAAEVEAAYIQNGDFEAVVGANDFTGWTQFSAVNSVTVLSGSHSAQLNQGANGSLTQSVSDPGSDLSYWDFSVDVAALAHPTQRSFQVNLTHGGGNINLIIKAVGDSSEIWVFNGSAWVQGLLPGAVDFSVDADGDGGLSGPDDTLAVNTLRVIGDYRETPAFDIHVTDSAGITHVATGLTAWQGAAPAAGAWLTSVSFQSGNLATGSFFIVDNVSVALVPEPASMALGALALGLVAMRRR